MNRIPHLALVISFPLFLMGCGEHRSQTSTTTTPPAAPRSAEPTEAVAVIQPIAGFTGSGVIHFTQQDQGVHVVATIKDFHPGKHGFHIHEYGDLSAADLSSLGGHFNPTGQTHGGPGTEHHHAGDLGNVIIGDDGQGQVDEMISGLTLTGDTGIIGRSVVIHEGEDDMSTDPAGNSGKRIAAGVIGVAKP
jgi:Cu-Zn family superoxide dismutase